MKFKGPTYEEYQQASKFAKLRYKYGVYIQAVALLLLFVLLFYTITNIEEMKANPVNYAEEKLGVSCLPMIKLEGDEYRSSRSPRNIK